jgi:hypothetical protein
MMITSIVWMAVCIGKRKTQNVKRRTANGLLEYRIQSLATLNKQTASSFGLWIWGPAAGAALLWPAHVSGPGSFDGAPLDGAAEAILVGVVLPALLWLHPRFLATRFARASVIALLGWKALTALLFVQDGWCVRFQPAAQIVKDETGAPHSWDIRADWRSADPSCSAIMTRPYDEFSRFPAWFFNLPPPSDSWPSATERPPGARTLMTVSGFLYARQPGQLQTVTGPDVAATVNVGGRTISGDELARSGIAVEPGVHKILIDATLTGDRWQFIPLWNGTDLWSRSIATVERPSAFDLAVRPWIGWVSGGLVLALALAWLVSFAVRIGNADALAWIIGASSCIGLLAVTADGRSGRWAIAGLLGACFLRLPARLRNTFGAFALIGIPWLTLIVVVSAPLTGRFRIYDVGSDFWMFQRYGYRIVMQGYWLEGGSPTFWFQPLYRWMTGGLHLIFGDSSVGEAFWDGGWVLVMAMLSFHITKRFGGFRWGLGAAVMTLTLFALGTPWERIGNGLSEISSAGLVSLAVLAALRSRHRSWRLGVTAGVLGTLAFYTRLNNLPMALAASTFALPIRQPVRAVWQPATLAARTSWQTLIAIVVSLGLGVLLFAWRTWYYTGVFSVFYGTQRDLLAVWQPGMAFNTVLARMAGSVMMVLTMNDPARFDPYALPLLFGTAISALAIVGVPRLRELPLGPVVFCLSGLVGAFVTRGSAYEGRFSVHVIAVNCAIVTCAAALMLPQSSLRREPHKSAASPRATTASGPTTS